MFLSLCSCHSPLRSHTDKPMKKTQQLHGVLSVQQRAEFSGSVLTLNASCCRLAAHVLLTMTLSRIWLSGLLQSRLGFYGLLRRAVIQMRYAARRVTTYNVSLECTLLKHTRINLRAAHEPCVPTFHSTSAGGGSSPMIWVFLGFSWQGCCAVFAARTTSECAKGSVRETERFAGYGK